MKFIAISAEIIATRKCNDFVQEVVVQVMETYNLIVYFEIGSSYAEHAFYMCSSSIYVNIHI